MSDMKDWTPTQFRQKILALRHNLYATQQAQENLADLVAAAQNDAANFSNALHLRTQQVEELTQTNVTLMAKVQEKAAQVEEFREKLAEKVTEEVQMRERHDRVMLYFGHYAKMADTRNGGIYQLPNPKGTPKKRNEPRIDPSLPLEQNIAQYDALYSGLPLKSLKELLG